MEKFTELEKNYVNEVNTYRDATRNVYFREENSNCYIIAKPIENSKSGYTFRFTKENYNDRATDFAMNLIKNSTGFDIRVKRNKNSSVVVAKPATVGARLIIVVNDHSEAIEFVRMLRIQEIDNLYTYQERSGRATSKGESLIERNVKKMKGLYSDIATDSNEALVDGDFEVAKNMKEINKREALSKAAEIYHQTEDEGITTNL